MLKNKGFEILISSDLQYEELCSEIYFEGQFVAVVTRENGLENAQIQIDNPPNSQNWSFDCKNFLNILKEAKKNLIKINEQLKSSNSPEKFNLKLSNQTIDILYDGLIFADISKESQELNIQIHSQLLRQHLEFPLNELISIIENAIVRLNGNFKDHLS
jgi:hypothetical protein